MIRLLPTLFAMVAMLIIARKEPWQVLLLMVVVSGVVGWYVDQFLDHVLSKYFRPPPTPPIKMSGRASVVLTLQLDPTAQRERLVVPEGTVFTDDRELVRFRILHEVTVINEHPMVALVEAVDLGSDYNIPAHALVRAIGFEGLTVVQHFAAAGGNEVVWRYPRVLEEPEPTLTLWDHLKES